MYWNVPRMVPCAVIAASASAPVAVDCTAARGLRQAEVEQLRARSGEHDVAGLQIAMHDAGAMRRVERLGDLNRDGQRLVDRQRAAFEPGRQRLAVDQLHDEKRHALVLADVVERADVRVRQARDRPRLALEPLAELGVGGQCCRQDLDRDGAIEPRVARPIDLAHPAGAEQRHDLVRSQPRSGWEHVVSCPESASSTQARGRRGAHRARAGRDIFFVRNAMVHPRQPWRRLAVELANRLQHCDLADRAEALRAVSVRRFQRGNQLGLGAIPRDASRRVLLEQSRIGLALKITVRARQLARHQQAGLDDVLHELARPPDRGVRFEVERRLGQVLDFGDDTVARVGPRDQHLIQQ